ncbi:MAG: hypothetical protein H6835_20270, partial [Planctomycetes bacterium]|nr:hypothetical protein [Planctomycetota bacterium]
WTLTASGWTSVACFDACAGRGGSTIVDLTANSPTVPGGPTVRQFLRLERDGWTSLPVPYATSVTARQLVTSAGRAEAWTVRVSDDARELSFARSRPGAQVEVDRTLYAVPEPAFAIGAFHCGLDDAGRMTVAINVVSPGGLAQGLRVVVFE